MKWTIIQSTCAQKTNKDNSVQRQQHSAQHLHTFIRVLITMALTNVELKKLLVKHPKVKNCTRKNLCQFNEEKNEVTNIVCGAEEGVLEGCNIQDFQAVLHIRKLNKQKMLWMYVYRQCKHFFDDETNVAQNVLDFLCGLKSDVRDTLRWEKSDGGFTFKMFYQIAYYQYLHNCKLVKAALVLMDDITKKRETLFDNKKVNKFINKCINDYASVVIINTD